MAEIKSFKALRYNSETIDDISTVIAPPYDVINKEQQESLYELNEKNVIRIDLNKEINSLYNLLQIEKDQNSDLKNQINIINIKLENANNEITITVTPTKRDVTVEKYQLMLLKDTSIEMFDEKTSTTTTAVTVNTTGSVTQIRDSAVGTLI